MKGKILLILIATLFSCQSVGQQEELITSEVINPSMFNSKLKEISNKILIDVRTKPEFENGTIEDAINLDILNGDFESELVKLDKSKTIFVFCAKGGRSGKAAKLLEESGFKTIYDLKGGYSNWNLK
jgi:rhodanese-related sulfurtransferase